MAASDKKYRVGDSVEVFCQHLDNGQVVQAWLSGKVVQADYRMVAVQFATVVYTNLGSPAPDKILWCTHGSQHLRRKVAL